MSTLESSENPLVILNPAANRGNMQHHRTIIHNRLAQEQAEYVETSRAGEAQELAMRAAKKGQPVVIVGGDGSVNEAVNGVLSAGRRVPLGIVPAGSGNDCACYTLGLPRDPAAALERALHGKLIDMDAGIVNGQYFATTFSVGLDANIAVVSNRLRKAPLMSGSRLYYTASLHQLIFGYHHCPWLKFSVDGNIREDEMEKHYELIAVTNGPTYGAGFRINPTADHTDGLLDVCAIRYTPMLRALKLLPVVREGGHSAEPEVTFYRAKTICIESKQLVNIQVDGETTRGITRVDARVLPGALWVRV